MLSPVQATLILSWIEFSVASGPAMKMFFHGGINDYMMFESWVPETLHSYLGAWSLFFFLGVVLEGFLVFAHNIQAGWIKDCQSFNMDDAFGVSPSGKISARLVVSKKVISLHRAFILAIFRFVESGLAYFLMLVTMIFNVGLFFSVISGHAFGVFLFSRFRANGSIGTESDPAHSGLSGNDPATDLSSTSSITNNSASENNPLGSPQVIQA